MAAPKENKFWELRSKHGREKLFETPALLWEACVEYFEYQNERNINEVDFVGKDARKVDRAHKPPFSKEGLYLYLGCCDSYLRAFKCNIKDKEDTLSKDFLTVLTRIDYVLFVQQYEGAATGLYNANIVRAKLGIADKQDIKLDGEGLSISVNVQDPALKDKLDKE